MERPGLLRALIFYGTAASGQASDAPLEVLGSRLECGGVALEVGGVAFEHVAAYGLVGEQTLDAGRACATITHSCSRRSSRR